MRRNVSSFFSWLEEEDYVLKSPMRRIHKIKTKQEAAKVVVEISSCHDFFELWVCQENSASIFLTNLIVSTGAIQAQVRVPF